MITKDSISKIDISEFISFDEEDWNINGLIITEDINPNLRYFPIRTNFYGLAICYSGSFRISINMQEYVLTKNSFMVFSPHQISQVLEVKDYEGVIVAFGKDFIAANNADSRLLDSFKCFEKYAIQSASFEEPDVRTLLEQIIQLRNKSERKDHPYRSEILRSLLLSLLYELEAIYQRKNACLRKKLTRKEELTISFQNLVLEHFREQRSVNFYADALCISPKYLSELLKEVSGKTASEIINEAVLLEAKVLLKDNLYNVAQVADMLHFADAACFSKFFKKHTEVSPSKYSAMIN